METELMAEIQILVTKRMGMQTDNTMRAQHKLPPYYTGDDFAKLARKMESALETYRRAKEA